MAKRKSQPIKNQSVDFSEGAGEGTRTHTRKAPDPKSGLSTNFNTPAKKTSGSSGGSYDANLTARQGDGGAERRLPSRVLYA